MNYTILAATPADFGEITLLWEAAVRETHHFLTEHHIQFYKTQIPIQYLPALSLFCIKMESEKIAGFIGLSGTKIEMLFVDPTHFGKGIGKRLALFAIGEQGILEVDVNEQNPRAVYFYKNLGFKLKSRSDTDGDGNPFPILSMQL